MSGRKGAGSKCKSVFVFHNFPPLPRDANPVEAGQGSGYKETYTVYHERSTRVQQATSAVYVPPSPVKTKPRPPVDRTPQAAPQKPSDTSNKIHHTACSTFDDTNLLSVMELAVENPYQSMWFDDVDDFVERDGGHKDDEAEDGPKKKKRKRAPEVRVITNVWCGSDNKTAQSTEHLHQPHQLDDR
jgi:hypothetical protein